MMRNRRCTRVLAGLFVAVTSAASYAGELELKPETLKRWTEYESAANLAMQQRLHSRNSFLRLDQFPERAARVRAGEIVAWPARPTNPTPVPSGLIHDWIGAGFVPMARIEDVLSVARDYGRYKETYKPGVLDARLLRQSGAGEQFSMVLRNLS